MDPKDNSELLSDHPGTSTRDADTTVLDTGENESVNSSITKCRKGGLKRHIVLNRVKKESNTDGDDTNKNEDGTDKSRDKYDKNKGQYKTPSDYGNQSASIVPGTLPGTQASDDSNKKQTIKFHKSHLYSVSLPTVAGGKKQVTVPIKKKAPVIIRNISTISVKKNVEEVADTEAKVKDNSSVKSVDSIQSKTIYIPQSTICEDAKESGHSTIDTHSEDNVIEEGSVISKSTVNSSFQNEESTKKKNIALSSVSSSQASPYNTRFAHMKVGTIFSVTNRSSGISKRKINKENAKPINENSGKHEMSVVRYEKPSIEEVSHDNGVCFLCGIAFADDMGISLNVKKPLPLSNIDLVSLLENFSISCASIQTQNLNYVNICNVCHTLVIEGDSTYKHLLSVATEMREQWPYRALKKNPVFSLNLPDSSVSQCNSHENVPSSRIISDKQEAIISEPKKARGRVGRPPKIRIKHEDESDENWRPTQVKMERSTHTGRRGRPPKRKIKRERRGRPRKIMIKGEASEDEVYTCGLCGESFFDENEWSDHFEAEHKTQLRWVNYRSQKKLKKLILLDIQQSFLNEEFTECTCHACDGKFYERNEFVEHLRFNHKMKIDDEFITSLYNYSQGHENLDDVSASDLEKEDTYISSDGTSVKIKGEIISQSEKSTFKCKVCHLVLDDEKALKDHTDTSHFSLVVITNDDTREVVLPEEKQFDCKSSGSDKQTSKPEEITDKEIDEGNEYACEECEEVFDTRHRLLEHKLNIHGSNDDKGQERGLVRYECEVCGRRIYGLAALRVHMTKVHYKTASSFKHSCSMCVYKSQSRSQLGKHMRSKHGKEIMPSVQCETCGKMYGPSYIAKHIATMHSTHTRNYECNFCDMKFYDMAGLKFHIYHEHANKVWKCNKCPMEFKKYHQLRQHRIFTHSTKVHACRECPKTYKRKSDLTEHVKRLHLQRVVLLCPRCPKQYVNRFKLRNHLMKHHDVPWEDTLARNYARHQRANNCRRTEEGVLEINKDQPHVEESSIFIQESYDHFNRHEELQECSDSFEGPVKEHEYHDDHFNRHNEEHEYHAHYRPSNNDERIQHLQGRVQQLASIKMEKEESEEEYIEIIEATDAFAKDGVTYVIIEET